MSNILEIGITALSAYQQALTVASQNIANADTPSYSRRRVNFSENSFNTGVSVADVRRVVDEASNRYLQSTTSDFSKWDSYYNSFSNFEQIIGDKTTNIGKFINESLAALQQIENNFDPTNRSLYLSRLSTLSQQFQNMNGEIDREILVVNDSLGAEVSQINNILNSISNINSQIVASHNADNPELLDQREGLVQALAKYFNFNATTNDAGVMDISLSNGFSLLSDGTALQFTTFTNPANPAYLSIGVEKNSTTTDVTRLMTGGEMAGFLNFREDGLASAQRALNRLALIMSENLNAKNKLGVDGNSNLGSNIFTDINTASMMSNRVIPNTNNGSSASMTVALNDVSQLMASDYKLVVDGSNNYVLTRLSDSSVVSSGTIGSLPQTITVDGFSLDIASGSFSAGDQYIISPTRGGANNMNVAITDPSALALGWPVNAAAGTKQPGSNGVITVSDITDTTTSAFGTPGQLSPPIEIRFSVSGGTYTYSLYNATTTALIEGPITYDPSTGADIFPTPGSYDPGYRVNITGSNIQNGDTFDITYNSNPTSDNRNARAMAGLYQSGTVLSANGNLVTFGQGFNQTSSDVSVKTNDAHARMVTSDQVRSQAEKRRDSISGVSLEEEAMDLERFQVAYQAGAQVLNVAKSIFESILAISRR